MISKVWIVPEFEEIYAYGAIAFNRQDIYEMIDEFGNVLIADLDPWQVAQTTNLLTALGVEYVEDYR